MSEVMKGSSFILPGFGAPVQILPQQQQAPHLSSCSIILSFQYCRHCQRVRQHSSHTIRRQSQWVLRLANKLQNGSFCLMHFPSSFYGDARVLKQHRPWPKEKVKEAFNLYPSSEPKRTVDVQSCNRPRDEGHRRPGNCSFPVTQLLTALEPQFPSQASVDQSKTRDLNAPGNLKQITSSSTLEVVQPGLRASSKSVPTVSIVSGHRRSWRAEKTTSDQRPPSAINGRPGPRLETSSMPGKQPLRRCSNRTASSDSNPNFSKQIEAGVGAQHVSQEVPKTEEQLRKTVWNDGRSTPGGILQSLANYGRRDWSPDTAQRNGSTHTHSAGTASEALSFLQNRLQRGITVDSYLYVDVLRRCSKQKDLLTAKQVHQGISQSGMVKNPYVASSLVNVYIQCGELLAARLAFNQLKKKSVVTWNTMLAGYAKSDDAESALELFKLMRQDGVQPDEVTYLCLLKACASPLALAWGKQVHEYVRHAGFESGVKVGTALLKMYAKCGWITEARRVFEDLTNRDVITWNIMIGAYAECGRGVEAYELFLQMIRGGFEPDAFTYMSILNASASAGALEWVKEVHGHLREAGLESDLRVGNALVHMYVESGSIDDARRLFDRMEKRDVVTWTVMIGGLAQQGCGHDAYRLFLQMRREGLEPDAITYMTILNASASAGALDWVKEVHSHASKAGLESDVRVGNALVHMYAKSGSIHEARRVFDRMEKRDVVTWTGMIGGLAQHGCGHEAYRLFLQMQREGLEPNAFTYVSLLNASASTGALEWVKDVHEHANKTGLESNLRVATALVHMYAESGSIDDARRVFNRIEKRDVFTWTTMIGGLAHHGCGYEALALFRKMNAELVKPNGTTLGAVLSACCHGGLLDEGRRLFSSMKQDYGIEPDIVHYTGMVDLLGRAGHLEEAKLFISDMPVEPGVITWTALLGACRTYGKVELGELAATKLIKLEPSEASTYVLLSNIYAAAGKWEKVSLVRSMMQERGVRKEPGRSWIEVDKKIHEFVAGDTSHPEARAIYTELNNLTERLKAEGYIPDTRLVLHDMNEEDKKLALCSHSEKLAIAYGLMHVPRGEPVRVRKNLRVCPDCHTATKLISKVTGRAIIARDVNRFHHFKDGLCSCGDYW